MDVRNEMEELVRDEVRLLRGDAARASMCWCRLCETDVVALALSLLPPLYSRPAGPAWSASIATASKIREAAQAAAKRVALRPKHIPGRDGSRRGEIDLVNYAWEVGLQVLGPSVAAVTATAEGCGCRECRADTLAYALNRYPPKYGVSAGGRRNLHPTYVDFMRHELSLLLAQAARVVSARPRH